MNHQQYISSITTEAAGSLTRLGCRIWSAHAHAEQGLVIAYLPPRVSQAKRSAILAEAWKHPIAIEWRSR